MYRTQTLFNACCRKDGGSGNGLHFVIAAEPCVMLNVICTLEHKVQDFCPLSSDSSQQMVYRADIGNVLNQIKDNMTAKLIIRVCVCYMCACVSVFISYKLLSKSSR
jgi:hypothetical protein